MCCETPALHQTNDFYRQPFPDLVRLLVTSDRLAATVRSSRVSRQDTPHPTAGSKRRLNFLGPSFAPEARGIGGAIITTSRKDLRSHCRRVISPRLGQCFPIPQAESPRCTMVPLAPPHAPVLGVPEFRIRARNAAAAHRPSALCRWEEEFNLVRQIRRNRRSIARR
jgi:hypothetical protein